MLKHLAQQMLLRPSQHWKEGIMQDSSVEERVSARGRWIVRTGVGLLLLAAQAAYAGSVGYTYDALGRLATAVYNNGTTTTTITYSYDAAGNRTSVVTTSP